MEEKNMEVMYECEFFKIREYKSDVLENNVYHIYNNDKDYIGSVIKRRVGKFMHWCYGTDVEVYLTNGCIQKISKFITKLHNTEKTNKS